ncbi:MAG: RHS repeat-associated core domain-containing protein [Pseudomonadota bacterium]
MVANKKVETSSSAYGCPQGKFNVDNSGQATFRLPLTVPPGVAGHTPKLDLFYNHRQANGVLGIGWSVSGLSGISRIKANYAIDGFNGGVNYDFHDRLALDGQRLINVAGEYGQPGTVYYTELHEWKRIQAGANIDSGFTVTMKNGDTWFYGTTPDSRIMAAGGTQVRLWALQAIEDLLGNRIEYHYIASPSDGKTMDGAYYLDQISYTVRDNLAPNRFVTFGYETRPDPISHYLGGYPVTTRYRLRQINTWLDDEQVRRYDLAYDSSTATGLSRLRSVTEFGSASSDFPALPPLTFDWQDIAKPGFVVAASTELDQHLRIETTLAMDVSGNGRSDLVQLWLDESDLLNATIYLAENGNNASFSRASDVVLGAFPDERKIFAADLSGNGCSDLLVAYRNGATGNLILAAFLSTGTGFSAVGEHDTGDSWSSDSLGLFAMDVNGDGRTDLVEAYSYDDPDQGQLLYFRSYLSAIGGGGNTLFGPALVSPTNDPAHPNAILALWPMDVNGDGMVDIVRAWQDGASGDVLVTSYLSVSTALDKVHFSAMRQSNLGQANLASQLAFLAADVNGDGMMDLLQVWQEPDNKGGKLHLTSFLADGIGGFTPGPDSAFSDQLVDPKNLFVMGFSGGGSSQLLSKWITGAGETKLTVFASSPSGEFRLLSDVNVGSVVNAQANDALLVGDVNGDGKADLIHIFTSPDGLPTAIPYVSDGAYPDLLIRIDDQLGGVTEVEYAPLSNPTVYIQDGDNGQSNLSNSPALRYPHKLSPGQFPIQAVLGQAIYVVSKYRQNNDSRRNRYAHEQQFSYTYRNARLDLLGRGWLGFAELARLDVGTGLRTRHTYNQLFPLTGTLMSLTLEADGSYSKDPRVKASDRAVLLKQTSTHFQALVRAQGSTPSTPSQPVYEVLLSATKTLHYDYGSDHLDFAIGHTFDYDDFGNLKRDTNLGYMDPVSDRPLDPAKVVYRHFSYLNEQRANGWTLGYLRWSKVSANPIDTSIDQFLPGDYKLEQRSYNRVTFTLASHGRWDDSNNVELTVSYGYDEYGNRIEEALPGGTVTRHVYESIYNCYLEQSASSSGDGGPILCTKRGFDPRYGVEVAVQDENGGIFITALDGFGRVQMRQGPVPKLPGVASDINELTPLVTGSTSLREAFLAAAVCTLERSDYLDDDAGGVYAQLASLQAFPRDGARDFLLSKHYCDALGRQVLLTQACGQGGRDVLKAIEYGVDGQISCKSLPYFLNDAPFWEKYQRDVLGRVLSLRQPGGATGNTTVETTWQYEADGLVTQTNAVGTPEAWVQRLRHRLFDDHDQVVESTVVDATSATTSYTYDALARLISSTDPATTSNPAGVNTTFTYDSLDRHTSNDNPDQNPSQRIGIPAMRYRYDSVSGRLASQADAREHTTHFTYDMLGRVALQSWDDGSKAVYGYDISPVNGLGRLGAVTLLDSNGNLESKREYTYDRYGNCSGSKLQVAERIFVSSSEFDPQNRLVRHVHPDDTVWSRQYVDGMLVGQSLDGARIDYPLENYTAAGRFGRTLYGAGAIPGQGVDTNYQYSPTGLLLEESVNNQSGQVLQLSFQYDALHQLLSVTNKASIADIQRFVYRNRRLDTAILPANADAHFDYDASGNLISRDRCQYTYQAHFVTSVERDGNQIYCAEPDACGRVSIRIVDGQRTLLTYDNQGHLQRVTGAGGAILREMQSDHLGRRLLQKDEHGMTIYVDAGYQEATRNGFVTVSKFLSDEIGIAAAIISCNQNTHVQYFRRDQKGSVTLAFNQDGEIQSRFSYDAYGFPQTEKEPGQGQPAYEHRQWDQDLGLYYFGARYYDPCLARFLTPDTRLGAKPLQPDSWNRFAFELNNPINHIDPSGHKANWVTGVLFGIGIGAIGLALMAVGTIGVFPVGGVVLSGLLFSSVGSGLAAAGGSAIGYSIGEREHFSEKTMFIQAAISFGIGAIAGGAMFGADLGITAAAGWIAENLASNSSRILLVKGGVLIADLLTGGVVGSATEVSSQFFFNLAGGHKLSNGLAISAMIGGGIGLAAGAFGGIRTANANVAEDVAEDVEMSEVATSQPRVPHLKTVIEKTASAVKGPRPWVISVLATGMSSSPPLLEGQDWYEALN